MKKILLLFIGALMMVALFSKGIQAGFGEDVDDIHPDNPVVLELFTSQSCSSCPPADELLGQIAQKKNVIALGFHVTYWDHLSWRDTLSREFATHRQRAYAAARGSRRIYTPQMVVNGADEFVGSNRGDLRRAMENAKAIKRISVSQDNQSLHIELPDLGGDVLKLSLFGVKSRHHQKIGNGENRGLDVTYHNAVLTRQDLGPWDGLANAMDVPIKDFSDEIDRYVVIAQKGTFGSGPIVAAGQSQ